MRAQQKNYRFLLSSEDKVHVESVLPGQLEAPVEAGQPVGSIQVFVNGDIVAKSHYAAINKTDVKRTWRERLLKK